MKLTEQIAKAIQSRTGPVDWEVESEFTKNCYREGARKSLKIVCAVVRKVENPYGHKVGYIFFEEVRQVILQALREDK